MDNAGEVRSRGHGHRVRDPPDLHRQVVGVVVAIAELTLGSRAPAGDFPVLVDCTGVQRIGVVIAGAERHDVVQARGGQMLQVALIAPPAGDAAIGADRAGSTPGSRQQRVAAVRSPVERDRAGAGPSTGLPTGPFTQAAVQQAGHLGPRHGSVGAVAQRVRPTADGDAGREQGVDVGFVDAAASVGEPRRRGPLKPEGPHQERRHAGPGHGLVGAVAQRVLLAPDRDPQVCQPLDVGHPPLIVVHVSEPRLLDRERVDAVDHSHDPHRHRPALGRVVGTEPARPALRAVEHALLLERVDVGLVRAV